MRRFLSSLPVSCFLLALFTVSPEILAAQTPRHVFYLTTGSTITTYSVDPTTGIPTPIGTLTISSAPFIGPIVPSPNDRFLYVFLPDTSYNYSLSVYDTDASGVPQSTPVQKLSAPHWQLIVHPSGKYAYVIKTVSGQQGYSETLYLYHINQTTGALTRDPKIQATYGPNYYYTESLISFNKAGTRLYDLWSVQFDGENNYFYSYHPVDTTTGQLSPDVGTIFAPSNFTGLDQTFFTSSFILNLHNDNSGNGSVLNVYPNSKNPPNPQFVCTQSMLNACGAATNFWVSVDEHYVFLPDSNSSDTVIGHIDPTSKKITQTGSIPGTPFLSLSPDNQLIYAGEDSTSQIQVYLFDSTTGTARSGGSITFTSTNGYSIYPAVRR